jgi:hypothetical protein
VCVCVHACLCTRPTSPSSEVASGEEGVLVAEPTGQFDITPEL